MQRLSRSGRGWCVTMYSIHLGYIVLYNNRLCRIYVLINIEHGLKDSDKVMLTEMEQFNINMQLVLTKCDKLEESVVNDKMMFIAHQVRGYKNIHPLLHAVSSMSKFGLPQLRYSLWDSFHQFQIRNSVGYENNMVKYLQA